MGRGGRGNVGEKQEKNDARGQIAAKRVRGREARGRENKGGRGNWEKNRRKTTPAGRLQPRECVEEKRGAGKTEAGGTIMDGEAAPIG